MSIPTSSLGASVLRTGLPEGYADAIESLIADGEPVEATVVTAADGSVTTALVPLRRCLILIGRDDGPGDLSLRFVPWTTVASVRAYRDVVRVNNANTTLSSFHMDNNAAAVALAARIAAYLPA